MSDQLRDIIKELLELYDDMERTMPLEGVFERFGWLDGYYRLVNIIAQLKEENDE